jgi:hypothetical protein
MITPDPGQVVRPVVRWLKVALVVGVGRQYADDPVLFVPVLVCGLYDVSENLELGIAGKPVPSNGLVDERAEVPPARDIEPPVQLLQRAEVHRHPNQLERGVAPLYATGGFHREAAGPGIEPGRRLRSRRIPHCGADLRERQPATPSL